MHTPRPKETGPNVIHESKTCRGGRSFSIYLEDHTNKIVVFERERTVKEGWMKHTFANTADGYKKAKGLFDKLGQ